MGFYISKKIKRPFNEAIADVISALTEEGFGVLTDIDISATLKSKMGVEWQPYRILGACNPQLAYRALQAEEMIGVMLPCNVIVTQHAGGDVEVAAIDPSEAMNGVANPELSEIAATVRGKLNSVLDRL